MGEKMDLITIVVPIYRVEPYLPRCIDSLLAQTYRNLELILVDDGSPDRCGIICEEYAAKDARVRVIHKENGGLSDARNAGMAVAKGEWIAFVDSDDWVTPDYLERMYRAILTADADICECGVCITADETVTIQDIQGDQEVFTPEEALKELILDRKLRQHVWNKLFRRSCIDGTLFAKGKINEDEFWTYQVFGRAKRVVRIGQQLYFYFQRPGSIMGTKYSLKRLDALEAKALRQQYVERNYPALADTARINLYISCIYAGQMTLRYLEDDEKREAYRRIDRFRNESRPSVKQLHAISGTQRLWCGLARADFWGAVRLKNLLGKGF